MVRVPSNGASVILGIDVGGTKTAVLLGTRDGKVLQRQEFPSHAERGFEALHGEIILGNLARRLGPTFVDPALQVMHEEALPALAKRCSVVLSELGDAIGDVAALSAALYHGGKHA
jgi:sugar (pentulose or hexulose) kinase